MNRSRFVLPRIVLPSLIVAMAVGTTPSHAYKMFQGIGTGQQTSGYQVDCNDLGGFSHWTTRSLSWYHNTAGQGAGKAAALQAALTTWNNVADSDWALSYAGTSNLGVGWNGQNTFVWDATNTPSLCNTTPCHAISVVYLNSGQVIAESDIVFNPNMDWRTDGLFDTCNQVFNGMKLDTQAIATHELGHSLGIHHPLQHEASFANATMGGQSCSVAGRSLETDDINAAKCIEERYPVSPSYEGYLETANCRSISGWAWNANRPNQPMYVLLKDGSQTDDVLLANIYRADLQAAGKGNGQHAFSITPGYNDGQWHTIHTQFSGNGNELTWSPVDIICGVSMFPGMFPDAVNDTGGVVYTVGTQFSSTHTGYITDLSFFKGKGETGSNTIRLYTDTGTQLASVTIPSTSCNTSPGSVWPGQWCSGAITPVLIQAGTRYRVTVNTNTKQAKTDCGIGGGITNGPLTAHQGFWIAGTAFPTTSSCSNFFVDVQFDI